MLNPLTPSNSLPQDAQRAALVGRVWTRGVGPLLVQPEQGAWSQHLARRDAR